SRRASPSRSAGLRSARQSKIRAQPLCEAQYSRRKIDFGRRGLASQNRPDGGECLDFKSVLRRASTVCNKIGANTFGTRLSILLTSRGTRSTLYRRLSRCLLHAGPSVLPFPG